MKMSSGKRSEKRAIAKPLADKEKWDDAYP
jgi:hypothetical protein